MSCLRRISVYDSSMKPSLLTSHLQSKYSDFKDKNPFFSCTNEDAIVASYRISYPTQFFCMFSNEYLHKINDILLFNDLVESKKYPIIRRRRYH